MVLKHQDDREFQIAIYVIGSLAFFVLAVVISEMLR